LLTLENMGSKETDDRKDAGELKPGQIVLLKSNSDIRGAIVGTFPGKPEIRYQVFVNGEIKIFYASQIQAEIQKQDDFDFLTARQFHCYLTALQLRYPGLSVLYSLNSARVDFIPYQFRPVLKFIRSDRPRLLIADGVGVGKTIEAGLILRELQARMNVRSVLIICPRPLVTERKWEIEMKRFEERFTHLDGKILRYCINEMDNDGEWPEQYRKIIIPFSLFDEDILFGAEPNRRQGQKKGLLGLDPSPRFDLVIVDEAHHIRNTETYTHKAVRFFCDHAEAVLFLTATPIQLGSDDLFVLLNALRPDLVIDKETYNCMAEPNPHINHAIALVRTQQPEWADAAAKDIEQAGETLWGKEIICHNPLFGRLRTRLGQGFISQEDRISLISDLESLYTFSGIINRTRRRDIGDFTVRKPETVVIDFTPDQKQFHDDLLRVQADIFQRLHGDKNVNFMMTTIRRQASSCLYGLVPFLQDILSRKMDELMWEEADDTQKFPDISAIERIEKNIQNVMLLAKTLNPFDPKADALKNILRNKQTLPNKKVMVFSSFLHTLFYLYKQLQNDGFRVGMVYGGTPDEERVEFRKRFEIIGENNYALDVLLFSEIGCEGLDYQFCDCIVNYDLPWNPMKIEQRIGRIDRKGQQSETIGIYNLITPGTVDADIYERCLLRIGIFNHALGDNEEILGEITKEIKNIAENFKLNENDRRMKLQQLADNKIRLMQEQEALEQKQLELFGIRLSEEHLKKEIEDASSFWLSPDAIRNLVSSYLQEIGDKEQAYLLGDKPLKTLRLSQDIRNRLLNDFQKLPRQNTPSYRTWENWLKGGNQHLSVTFDTICASENPKAEFLMPLHPLIRQAADSFDMKQRVMTCLKLSGECRTESLTNVSEGIYFFAVYQWQFHGIREDQKLVPVSLSEQITAILGKLLEKAEDNEADKESLPDASIWDEIDAHHHAKWSQAREQHIQRTREMATYRRESLSVSHRARMSLLKEQLAQANNEKIQRMRQSQIAAAEDDYARRMQEIEMAMERVDLTAQPVGYGILRIERSIENA